MFWGRDLEFQGHRSHKGQIRLSEHNSKLFRAMNLKLGTDTGLRSGQMPIHWGQFGGQFGVTECKKVKSAPRGISGPGGPLCGAMFFTVISGLCMFLN